MLKSVLLRSTRYLTTRIHIKDKKIESHVFFNNFIFVSRFNYSHGKVFLARLSSCNALDYFRTSSTYSSFSTHSKVSENEFAYLVLKRNPAYANTLAPTISSSELENVSEDEFCDLVKKEWAIQSAENVLLGFKKLSFYSDKQRQSLSDEKYNALSEALVSKCSLLNDDDLISVLGCLRKWSIQNSAKAKNYVELWNAIDKQCYVRMEKWDRNKLLFVADHWHLLYLGRISDFMWHCTTRLSRKPEKLTPQQLVQCMFYINVRRKFPPHVSVYDFEYSLINCVDQLTLDELGIMAMGFFKSEKPIRSQNLLHELMRRIVNEVESIHEITLAALLKVIRYSLQPVNADMLFVVLDKLLPQIDRLSLLCCTHIALAGTNTQLYHEGNMNKIVQRYSKEIQSTRLKDLERIAFALSLYNYEDKGKPSIYDLIAEELGKNERNEEIKSYPRCFVCCLHYLSLQKIFLKEHISRVLDKDFIRETYGRNMYKVGREILNLDISMEIECPSYIGNRIEPKMRAYLSKIYTDSVWQYEDLVGRKLSATDRMLLEVVTAAVSILGGQEKVHLGHLIPHRERADIVYGIRADGSVVNIPNSFRNLDIGVCKRPPNIPNTTWYCIVIVGWNSFIRNIKMPVGLLSCKLRHLQILGYHPVMVPWYEWRFLPVEEQTKYLEKKICAETKDKVMLGIR
ncbi:FAST kinase domain-containing protein 5, mitochondrial isoform X1 [Periplaneta americana]|uniref:FAST kinase domain-containing protein 5, mitochondrial isoform X1 n=1 Tax=Periplaneta americana TaxID=6978 RepID=UPI0037E940BA